MAGLQSYLNRCCSICNSSYKQRHVLQKYVVPIAGGVLVGTTVAIASDFAIASLMGTDKSLILSSLPKSVTMPVAMSVSEQVGGVPSLTATFVVIAGITGTITGPFIKMESCYKLSW